MGGVGAPLWEHREGCRELRWGEGPWLRAGASSKVPSRSPTWKLPCVQHLPNSCTQSIRRWGGQF